MNRLQNKVVLITGAARGLGAASAALFAKEGATVILTDVMDEEGESQAARLNMPYEHLDVSIEDAWVSLTEKLMQEYKQIDVIFNNAGILGLGDEFGPQDPEHASISSWHKVHAINLDGVFLGCKYGIQMLKAKGGSIINMSSRSALVGVPGASAYASSKAAIMNHTRSVALYCAQKNYNIRCNAIHPGAVMTGIWEPMLGKSKAVRKKNLENIEAGIPLGHMGEPLDVAYLALYLASDESKYMTGSALTLDGGILAGSSSTPEVDSEL